MAQQREETDVWGWRAPDDGLEYKLEVDGNGSMSWRCVNCNTWVTDGHLTCRRHLSWLEWAGTRAAANPWVANAAAAPLPLARQLAVHAGAASSSSGPPPPPPGPPPPGTVAGPPPPPPAVGATATSEQLQQQQSEIQQLQAMVEAQNKTIDEMQGEVKATLQQQSEQLQQQSENIQQLRAIVKAQSKTIAEMQETLEAWSAWWWWSEAEKTTR